MLSLLFSSVVVRRIVREMNKEREKREKSRDLKETQPAFWVGTRATCSTSPKREPHWKRDGKGE